MPTDRNFQGKEQYLGDVAVEFGTDSAPGTILCKFEDGTNNLRALGKFLQRMETVEFQPYLFVRGDNTEDGGTTLEISPTIIERMIEEAIFEMDGIMVEVDNDKKPSSISLFLTAHDGLEPDGFALSGFPKVLSTEYSSRPRKRTREDSVLSHRSPASTSSNRSRQSSETISRSGSISLNSVRSKSSRKIPWIPKAGPMATHTQNPLAKPDSSPQPQLSYRDVKGPNRFWAYIGPAHMAKHRHMYSPETLTKFIPSIADEPVGLDAGEEHEVKRVPVPELDAEKSKRTSYHHEVSSDSTFARQTATLPSLEKRTRRATRILLQRDNSTDAIMEDCFARLQPLPFAPPPPFPAKKRGFDPGELEAALEAAFG